VLEGVEMVEGKSYQERSPHASRVGKAVEHLVAAGCILISDAKLNVSTSLVDDEGVDLVFHQRGGTATLAVQVKSRSTDTSVLKKRRFIADVRKATFEERDDLYMLFVVVDRSTATLGPVWLVPSRDFAEQSTTSGGKSLRISANAGQDARDRWLPYRLDFDELPRRILEVLEHLERR
jgi:hypothetical protein